MRQDKDLWSVRDLKNRTVEYFQTKEDAVIHAYKLDSIGIPTAIYRPIFIDLTH